MIDFRYHLVSIIAVFFALAVGIVLGAGPLGERIDETLPERLAEFREENNQLREQIIALGAEHSYQEAFVGAVTEELIGNRLDRRDVLVVALPDADEAVVEAVTERLQMAGANVTATVGVDSSWTEPESEAALDTLAAELVSSGSELPEEGTGYERGAAVLAGALLRPPDDVAQGEGLINGLGDGVDAGAYEVDETAVAGFAAANFIQVGGEPETKASLSVVVAGQAPRIEPADGEEADDAEPAVDESWISPLTDLLGALDATGAGTVVAGSRAAAEQGELLHVVRSDEDLAEAVSTVDQANLPSGQIAIVYAVAEQASGGVGQYGGVGAEDGALPPVAPRVPPLIEETPPESDEDADDGDSGGDDSGDGASGDEDVADGGTGDVPDDGDEQP